MKSRRSGCVRMTGMRRVCQSWRARLTLARRRSAATSDFFVCEAETRQEAGYRGMVDLDTFRRRQRIAQLEQRDVRILGHKFFEKALIRGQLAPPFGATLRRGSRMLPRPDRPRPPRPCRRQELQPHRRRPPAQAFLDIPLKTHTKRLWQRC